MSDVLGGCPEQVLQLDRAELLDDSALLTDALVETLLELIEFSLFLVEVLNKSPSSLLHLMETSFKSLDDTSHWPLDLSPVLRVPNVMSNELLDGLLPLLLEKVLITHNFELVHEPVDILNQDIVSSDQHLLLLALVLGALSLRLLHLGVGGLNSLAARSSRVIVRHASLWSISLIPHLLLRSGLLHGVGHTSLHTVLADVLLPLLVGRRLDLSLSTLLGLHALRR